MKRGNGYSSREEKRAKKSGEGRKESGEWEEGVEESRKKRKEGKARREKTYSSISCGELIFEESKKGIKGHV